MLDSFRCQSGDARREYGCRWFRNELKFQVRLLKRCNGSPLSHQSGHEPTLPTILIRRRVQCSVKVRYSLSLEFRPVSSHARPQDARVRLKQSHCAGGTRNGGSRACELHVLSEHAAIITRDLACAYPVSHGRKSTALPGTKLAANSSTVASFIEPHPSRIREGAG
jgi:hypothetical protein